MLVSVVFEKCSNTLHMEVNSDLQIRSFIEVILVRVGISDKAEEYIIIHSEKFWSTLDIESGITLEEIGVKNADVLILICSSSLNGNKSVRDPVADLIQCIRISKQNTSEVEEIALIVSGYRLFQNMVDAYIRASVCRHCPLLDILYDKCDLGSFILVFRNWQKQETLEHGIIIKDLEKQQIIDEDKRLKLLDRNLEQAIELIPESFVQVQMLFIRVSLNNYNTIALVDTGAQVSILSKSAADRCHLMQLIDSRFKVTAQGIGGGREAMGKITKCEIVIGEQKFLCSLTILSDDNTGMDLIIGLDMLLKYKAVIDLKTRTICFGEETTVHFLSYTETKEIQPFLLKIC